MYLVARAEAQQSGLKQYYTGHPCQCGHISARYVSTGHCVECDRLRKTSPRVREQHRQRQAVRRQTQAHKDWVQEYTSRPEVRERNTELKRAVRATPTGRSKDNDTSRRYRQRHKGNAIFQARAHHNKAMRRARKLGLVGLVSSNIKSVLLVQQKNKCAFCNKRVSGSDAHLDHIVPLALDGMHADANLQVLCARCNQRKNAKHPLIFARENGRLF